MQRQDCKTQRLATAIEDKEIQTLLYNNVEFRANFLQIFLLGQRPGIPIPSQSRYHDSLGDCEVFM